MVGVFYGSYSLSNYLSFAIAMLACVVVAAPEENDPD